MKQKGSYGHSYWDKYDNFCELHNHPKLDLYPTKGSRLAWATFNGIEIYTHLENIKKFCEFYRKENENDVEKKKSGIIDDLWKMASCPRTRDELLLWVFWLI